MRSAFVCVLTLLIWNQLDRREATKEDVDTDPVVFVVDPYNPFAEGRLCHRNLYPSYLGNSDRNCWVYLGMPPGGSGRHYDRHLYPSYLGNQPVDRALDYLGGSRVRMHEIDVRELPCETSMYPSYIGNTRAWNACRRAKGLLTATD